MAEDYIHRIGRTGRAGNTGLAISLMSPKEEWLLTAIEEVLDTKLLQQWLPGYEPDLSKPVDDGRNSGGQSKGNGRNDDKRRAKNRSYGKKTNNRAKKDTKPSR